MKLTIVTAVLLGVFFAPSLALQDVNVGQTSDRKAHQGVSVDHDKNVAIVTSNNGQQSWVSVLDYKTGFVATRILATKSCVLAKMNKDVMPAIDALPKALDEMKKSEVQRPPPKEVRYTVSEKKIQDLTQYGEDIAALCHGLPAYEAYEIQGANFFYVGAEACLNVNVLFILRLDLCLGISK